jgi:bifunctional DNA-binding transcriptional regulator/antitoxin component of YhaV-PrlF toxin-antitoxin module
MKTQAIKNKRAKISPAGIITLPLPARKVLGMSPNIGSRVSVAVVGKSVELKTVKGEGGMRVSPKGQMDLQGDARETLQSGTKRHIWIEVSDDPPMVVVHPWADE